MNIKLLVPVKGNSERVRNKNLRPFCGTNLLELKLGQLERIFPKSDIIVNSESHEMLDIAKNHGVNIVKRDQYYTRNDVSMSDVYKNMAENVDSEYIAYINVTNPLVKDDTYRSAITMFSNEINSYDSLVSCHEIKEFLWVGGKPINYNPMDQPRSQDLPDVVALNFAISIISKKDMVKYKNIIGKKPYFFKINVEESLDIDTPLDFYIAEKCLERQKCIY